MHLALMDDAIILPEPALLADLSTSGNGALVGCSIVILTNVLVEGGLGIECTSEGQQAVIVETNDGWHGRIGTIGLSHAMELAVMLAKMILAGEDFITELTLILDKRLVVLVVLL